MEINIRRSVIPDNRRNRHTNRRMNRPLNRRLLALLSLALLLATLFTACSEPVPVTPKLVLNPKVTLTKQLAGDIYTREAGQAISPDGKYMLVQQRTSDGTQIVAVSLMGETDQDVTFEAVGFEESSSNYAWLLPIGWTSSTTCVFTESGKQNDGAHQGKDGVLVMSANVETGQTEEIGFIELEAGYLHDATYVEDRAKVYLHVTRQLWEVDLNQGTLRLVKDELPTYDGLMYVRISPTGEYAVYDLHEEDKNGLYILDIGTAKRTPIASYRRNPEFPSALVARREMHRRLHGRAEARCGVTPSMGALPGNTGRGQPLAYSVRAYGSRPAGYSDKDDQS